jgi:hypothetical protein
MEACPSNRAGLGPCLGYGNPFHNLEQLYGCRSSRLSPGKKPFSERVRTQRLTVDGKVAVVLTPRAGHRIKEVYLRHWDAKTGRHQLGIVTELASGELLSRLAA